MLLLHRYATGITNPVSCLNTTLNSGTADFGHKVPLTDSAVVSLPHCVLNTYITNGTNNSTIENVLHFVLPLDGYTADTITANVYVIRFAVFPPFAPQFSISHVLVLCLLSHR